METETGSGAVGKKNGDGVLELELGKEGNVLTIWYG